MLLVSGCAANNPKLNKELKVTPSIISSERAAIESENLEESGSKSERVYSETDISDWGGVSAVNQDSIDVPALEGPSVSFAADELPIKEFSNRAFQEILGINYVLSAELAASSKKLTLNFSEEIPRPEFYQAVIKTMQESGISAYYKDKIIYLTLAQGRDKKNTISVGIGKAVEDVPDVGGAITQIVPFVYSSSRNLTSILDKLSTATVTVYGAQKLLILEGEKSEIIRAVNLINMLDVPRAYGREIRLFEFAHIAPDDGVKKIRELLTEDGLAMGSSGDVSFVTIPRINSVVVYASSAEIVDRMSFWAQKIDVPIAGDERQYFVFKPLYAKAEDMKTALAPLLQNFQSDKNGESSSAQGGSTPDGKLSFSLNKQQNSLIFYATKDEYRLVESLLEKMDSLPGQVILDVTILEVTLTDSAATGVEWAYNSKGMKKPGSSFTLSSAEGAIAGTVISGNWKAEPQWKDKSEDIRVLSRPYFIVRDGESATINSGLQVPIITQTVEDIGNNNSVSNSVQYRSTGISVSISPTINSQGVISLSVSMSNSNAESNELGGSNSPVITNRSISTEILSSDGQTVALGGLIQESKNDQDNSVPLLSELPLLGNLFKSKSDSVTKTELIMLITTKIVKESTEVDDFTNALSELYSTPITIN